MDVPQFLRPLPEKRPANDERLMDQMRSFHRIVANRDYSADSDTKLIAISAELQVIFEFLIEMARKET